MATAMRKKSAAYEAGVREGRADKSKGAKVEIEITPEGEEEKEGPDAEEMDSATGKAKPPSRKRSAKGAKSTKAPMDAECGCGGRKGKAACDGTCGSSAKKMDRNDALTPQEYLAACDLGIQGRSRSYIRSRLDATERLDKKCGASGIADNKKCTKGSGGPNKMLGTLAAATLIGGSIAVSNEIDRRKQQELKAKDILNKVNAARFKANAGVTAAARSARNGVDFARTAGYYKEKPDQREQAVNRAISEGMGRIAEAKQTRAAAYSEVRQSLNELGQIVPKSPARRRRARQQRQQPGGLVRLNSLYADGFTPELAQLAI
jgi:hypothetical protein